MSDLFWVYAGLYLVLGFAFYIADRVDEKTKGNEEGSGWVVSAIWPFMLTVLLLIMLFRLSRCLGKWSKEEDK